MKFIKSPKGSRSHWEWHTEGYPLWTLTCRRMSPIPAWPWEVELWSRLSVGHSISVLKHYAHIPTYQGVILFVPSMFKWAESLPQSIGYLILSMEDSWRDFLIELSDKINMTVYYMKGRDREKIR